jgi:hypothetical protein
LTVHVTLIWHSLGNGTGRIHLRCNQWIFPKPVGTTCPEITDEAFRPRVHWRFQE